MPSPRATSKDSSGKRSAAGRSGAVSSRSAAASKPAPEAAPAAPAPAPEPPKPAVSLIDETKPAPAAKPKVMRALPTIGKKPPVAAPAPAPVVIKTIPAPAAPATEVVDLISGSRPKRATQAAGSLVPRYPP